MAECMICDNAIVDDNKSDCCDTLEHLLPLAIGGKKGVRGFIHRICNSRSGETWDAALAEQLQPLSLMFDIARQSGDVPPLRVITTAEEHFSLGPGGQLRHADPIFRKKELGDGKTEYQIKARDMSEARKMLVGLKRKHPEIDVEAWLAKAQIEESYAQGAVHHELHLGGEIAGRSIMKSCLAIAFANGIHWRQCGFALDYIRNSAATPCFGFYQARDLVGGRTPGMPFHCLAFRANPESGLILAYVEYFGIHRVVACLGEGYKGALLEGCYAIDPRNGQSQSATVDLPFSKSDIKEIYDYQHYSPEIMKNTADAVIGPAMKTRYDAEQQRVISRVVNTAFDNCGAKPGERLTHEHLEAIAKVVGENVTPFLAHRVRPITLTPNRNARRASRSPRKKK